MTVPSDNYPPFRLVRGSEFSCQHLEEYPVWSEFYDYDEREEIISWGIDADWLDQELDRCHSGNDHAFYPLLAANPFPPRRQIFIKARYRTPAGHYLSGYVVNEDDHLAVFICQGGKEFWFNSNMPDWAVEGQKELQGLMPDATDPIFPLDYETDYVNEDGQQIKGSFDFESLGEPTLP